MVTENSTASPKLNSLEFTNVLHACCLHAMTLVMRFSLANSGSSPSGSSPPRHAVALRIARFKRSEGASLLRFHKPHGRCIMVSQYKVLSGQEVAKHKRGSDLAPSDRTMCQATVDSRHVSVPRKLLLVTVTRQGPRLQGVQ